MNENCSFFRIIFLCFIVVLFAGLPAISQVGIGTTNPDANAALDIVSTNQGILIPRVALTALNNNSPLTGAPVEGVLVYNTATSGSGANAVTPGFYYHNGNTTGVRWVRFSGAGDTKTSWELLGNAGTNPNTNFLGTTDDQLLRIKTNNVNRFDVTTGGQLLSYGFGTAASPTYSWSGNRSTAGMYSPMAHTISFTTNSTERLRIPNAEQIHAMSPGTPRAPFYSWNTSTRTGLYLAAPNVMGLVSGGNERLRIPNVNQIHAMQAGSRELPFYSWADKPGIGMYTVNDRLGFSTGGDHRFLITDDWIESKEIHRFAGGLRANPGIAFEESRGTGFWRAGTDILATSTAGEERMRIDRFGRVLVNTTSNAIPGTIDDATFRFLVRADGNANAAMAAYHTGQGPSIFMHATNSGNNFYSMELVGNNGATMTSNNGATLIRTLNSFLYYALSVDADAIALLGWYTLSDRKFKRDIRKLNEGGTMSTLDKVMKLEPVSYKWRADEFPGMSMDPNKTSIGFIAQEVYELFPEVVNKDKLIDNPKKDRKPGDPIDPVPGYYAINYGGMVPILTQAIQEQQVIIDTQNIKITELEQSVDELKQLVQELLRR